MNQSGAQTRAPVHLDTLTCRICHTVTEAGPYHVCEECFGPLEVVYDLEELRGTLTREKIADRPTDLWRYRELLPTAVTAKPIMWPISGKMDFICGNMKPSVRGMMSKGSIALAIEGDGIFLKVSISSGENSAIEILLF